MTANKQPSPRSQLALSITNIGDLLVNNKLTTNQDGRDGNGIRLVIPPYQRPYKWTAKNAIQLLDDILDAMSGNKEVYRVGTLILYKNENNDSCEIVDGQQRAITFALLLKALGEENIELLKQKTPDNPELLVFPQCLETSRDEVDNLHICSYSKSDDRLYISNFIGFVGVNDIQLNMRSRFATAKEDYFLHDMLKKAFCPNILKLEHDTSKDPTFLFLMYMFPHCLNEAMRHGVCKESPQYADNERRVKGLTDALQRIRRIIPFNKIACNAHKSTYDKQITQLIRHTIEYLLSLDVGKALLNDRVTSSNIQTIRDVTPTYNENNRKTVIKDNQRKVRHHFTKYTALQKLCVSILRHKDQEYGTNMDKVHGILFDVEWLWKEYLNASLMPLGFVHVENNTGKSPIYALKDFTCFM